MKTVIYNGTIITGKKRIENSSVYIEHGRITEILPEQGGIPGDWQVIDAEGAYVVPGFIDLHFHGAMGKDTMDAAQSSLCLMSEYCATHGVTSFYPTTWSASQEDIWAAILAVKEYKDEVIGARIMGVHIEGPYVNNEYRGAQLPEMIRNPKRAEYLPWFDSGVVKILTCAPEIEGARELIAEAKTSGVRVSIGHSGANYELVNEAAAWGATQATHIFNGMQGLHHRDPGTVGGVLDNNAILAQVICDGVHLHPAVVRMIRAVKTSARIALITDSVRGAGLADGEYEHKRQVFSVREGVARTPEGSLSGSTLTLSAAMRNYIEFTGSPLEEALSTITAVPALEMGLAAKKGRVALGYDADLVLLDHHLEVMKTMINGEVVYTRD